MATTSVYGDKAYGSKGFRDFLKERGIKDQVMHKATKNKVLTHGQRWFNKAVSGIRFEVEQPFGIDKLNYGLARTRYRREERVNTGNYLSPWPTT